MNDQYDIFKTVPLKPDPEMMRKTLKLIGVGPEYVTELRVLEVRESQNNNFPYTFGGFFDDTEKLIKNACSIKYALGWYIVLNPCHPDALYRIYNRAKKLGREDSASDNDILRRKWLPIDLDPVRISRISSTDEEHQMAIQRAMEVKDYLHHQGWSDPIVADSGNGGHLLYSVDLPVKDDGFVENCLKALDRGFSDDKVKVDKSVATPARIWKLYGTPACKGDNTKKRPHRMAKILQVPDGL